MIEVSPFLSFNGNCESAFNFYKSIFGGAFEFIYRYKDVPSENPIPESEQEKILHVSLPLMKNVNLMGADVFDVPGQSAEVINRVTVGLRTNNQEETLRIFDALSEGGKVTMPLQKAFFADLFGSVTDRFGISWSINYNIGRQQK